MKLIYPKLPIGQDKRKVLTSEQISEIIRLNNDGLSTRKLAAMFGVSKTCISYHLKSSLDKEKYNKKRYQLIKNREQHDPDYKEFRRKDRIARHTEMLKRNPEFMKYQIVVNNNWRKKKYHSDETFRNHIISLVKKSQRKRRERLKLEKKSCDLVIR